VPDNAAILKIGKNVAIWHSHCNISTAKLYFLAKDILNKTIAEYVKLI